MNRAFTLLEVVLALLLLSLGTLATVALLRQAAISAGNAERRERLLWGVEEVLDSLMRDGVTDPGSRTVAGVGRVDWRPEADGGRLEVWLTGRDSVWMHLPVSAPDRDVLRGGGP